MCRQCGVNMFESAMVGSSGLNAGAGRRDCGGSGRPTVAEKRLTKEIAEQFLTDDCSEEDLEEFTELDDGAAERLSKHQVNLSLGLDEIHDAVSENLRQDHGSRDEGPVNGPVLSHLRLYSSDKYSAQFEESRCVHSI